MSTQSIDSAEIPLREQISHLELEVAVLRRAIGAQRYWQELFRSTVKQFKDDKAWRLHVRTEFAEVPKEHKLWKAIHLVLNAQIALEHLAAKSPGMSPSEREFNTGRESALEDFQNVLLEIWATANPDAQTS